MKVTITEKMKLQLGVLSLAFCLMVSVPLNGNEQKFLVVTQQEMAKAEAGGSVNISCSFMASVPSYSVKWTLGCNLTASLQDLPCFQRRVIIYAPDSVQSLQVSTSTYEIKTTITIINLTEDDSGIFCCHIMLAGGKKGTGNGTRLEVTPRSSPAVPKDQGRSLTMYILYAVVGAEACVILFLIAVVMRYHPRGLWRSEDQLDHSELQYSDICWKRSPRHSRPRIKVDAVTYSAVRDKKEEHLTNQAYEFY